MRGAESGKRRCIMPALTTCPNCGFDGPHGFSARVGGIMHYYHGACNWWSVPGADRSFGTLADAWRALREQYADDAWRQAWDARIIERKERKAARIFKQWGDDWRKGGA